MIATSDQFTGQYRDQAQMIEAMIGRARIAAREKGWSEIKLVDFEWHEHPGRGALVDAPLATIVVGPGHSGVTVEDCRRKLKEKLEAAKKAGDLFASRATPPPAGGGPSGGAADGRAAVAAAPAAKTGEAQ